MKSQTLRRYLEGVVAGFALRFGTVFIGFWLTPLVLQYLDQEAYGIFLLASSLLAWLKLVDVGLSPGLKAVLAKASGSDDVSRINEYATSAFVAQLGVAVTIGVFGAVLGFVFPRFFPVSAHLTNATFWTIILLATGGSLFIASQPFNAILFAYQRIRDERLLLLLLTVIRATLTVQLLTWGWGLVATGAAYLIGSLITAGAAVFRSLRVVPELRISRSHFSWKALREVGGTGLWFTAGEFGGLIVLATDRAVAGRLVSLKAVAVLYLTGRLYALAQSFLEPLINSARPAIGQLLGQNDTEKVASIYGQMLTLCSGAALVCACAVFAGNKAFVSAWVTAENYGGWALDFALGLNALTTLWMLPSRAVLTAGLVVKPQAIIRLAEALLNLTLSILLTMRFGLVGVALSTSIAGALTSCWYLPRLVLSIYGGSSVALRRGLAPRLILVGAVLLPTSAAARQLAAESPSLFSAVGAASVVFLLGAALVWFLVLDGEIRSQSRQMMPSFAR